MREDLVRNPYDALHPTSDPTMFFGRDDVFAFIRQRLITGRRAQAIALIGQRGMGKTSVLMQVIHHIEPRFLTAHIDLGDVRFEEVGGLFAAMADAARQALDAAGISTYRLPPVPDDPSVDLWVWFSQTYLDVTLSALRNNRRLIFLFDESSKLLDAIDRRDVPETFATTISQLMARDDRLDIIFTVDAEDEHRLETFAPLTDPMLHKRLTLLDDEAATDLIRRPSAAFYEVQDEAVEGILAMTGGHPYLLHVLNGLLWERAIEREQGYIALNDVREVLRQATDEADPVLRQTWTHSTPNERMALSALTALTAESRGLPIKAEDVRLWLLRESDHPLDETGLAASLRRLEYREVLRAPTKGTYTFTTGLQHQWLILNGDVQPPATLAAPTRVAPRQMVIPVVLLLVVVIVAALALSRLTTIAPKADSTLDPATVTLDQNLLATRRVVETMQTQAPIATPSPTDGPTSTLPVEPASTSDNPTSVLPAVTLISRTPTSTFTLTPSDTPTPSITLTPSVTDTPTDTLTPSDTPTEIISVTPPVFPTGQLHATSTFSSP